MKKFGFGKKSADGGDDPNRAALFGGKKGSPAPAENPYAQPQTANDPYMNDNNKYMSSYSQARSKAAGGLPTGPGPQGGYNAPSLNRQGSGSSTATAPPPYNDRPAPGGYGSDRYGSSTGYGGSKYATSGGYGSAPNRPGGPGARGPGGYGGLGPNDNDDTDANRDALFSGAQERYKPQQTTAPPGGYGQSGPSGAGADPGASKYGGYGEQRELTEEERENHEYQDIKQQIHETTDASLASTQNTLRYMDQALDTASQTYARLGAQNERLHHTDQLLDQAYQSNIHADAQTKKLKSLNRSMFAVHVNNPFTAKRRTAEQEARVLAEHQDARATREDTRKQKFAQNSRMEQTFNRIEKDDHASSSSRPNRGDRSKYTFEDDSDEEGRENLNQKNDQIEDNIDEMMIRARKMHLFSKAVGEEIEEGNKVIDRLGLKSDRLEDGLAVSTERMRRTK